MKAHYPTSAELSNLRRDFALADERAPFHAITKARIERGQPWNAKGLRAYLATPGKVRSVASMLPGRVLFGRDGIAR